MGGSPPLHVGRPVDGRLAEGRKMALRGPVVAEEAVGEPPPSSSMSFLVFGILRLASTEPFSSRFPARRWCPLRGRRPTRPKRGRKDALGDVDARRQCVARRQGQLPGERAAGVGSAWFARRAQRGRRDIVWCRVARIVDLASLAVQLRPPPVRGQWACLSGGSTSS